MAAELGEDLNDEEIQEMIDEADQHGIGAVCAQDYWMVLISRYRDIVHNIAISCVIS